MRQFQAVTATEFADLARDFPWTRQITEVHLHHTWRPRQRDYRGRSTIEGMWRHHTTVNGWSDIAQHVSIAPDGTIWIGRNFNWAPASASGFNGNRHAGPFMIEMIGDFDVGRETITSEQKKATLTVIKAVQQKFTLPADKLRFHNEMSSKSCPGNSQDKTAWISEIEGLELPTRSRDRARTAFADRSTQNAGIIAAMNPAADQPDNLADADHQVGIDSLGTASRGTRGDGEPRALDPQIIEELSDHIVNLTGGRFSNGGIVSSSEIDVDRIVEERLTAEIESARSRGDKARVLIYAHGGLVSERTALLAAFDQLRFWRANNVYPIFFIWETGLAETLKQMIFGARDLQAAPRGPVREWMDDRVEDVVRTLGADKIWSGMKRSAERSSATGGGARYVGEKLAGLFEEHHDHLELHMAGHSAGSIFNAHFLSTLPDSVRIRSGHFLAPAITSSAFKRLYAPELGQKVEHLSLFTMTKARELADTVTRLYGKSLLYMIYNVLEPTRETDVLGLEVSLRGDHELRSVFGLGARGGANAEVIWSPSTDAHSGTASNSTTHGGFDNDAATLESVCRRILGKVNGEHITPYQAARAAPSVWDRETEWPHHLRPYLGVPVAGATVASEMVGPVVSAVPAAAVPPIDGAGRRRALCIGIDQYRDIQPLAGCVNDMRSWSAALTNLGFAVDSMSDSEATADAIIDRIRAFVGGARAGDKLVFQFAGHGTEFDDESGDETDRKDSALCAVDCGSSVGRGGLVLDDDIFEAFKLLPEGASLTAFIDCCHSGTMTRALGAPPRGGLPADARPRFVRPTPEMVEAYHRLKEARAPAASSGSRSLTGQEGLIGVQFSACQDSEVAFEFSGAGHFTSIATRLLPRAAGLTNRAFHDRLIAEFGSERRQTPNLYCEPAAFDQPLAVY